MAIPGDYNLALFDRLLENQDLAMISCCNELNAGYAADGYARAHGVGAMLVTYSVGGLSAINAAAGHYAEDLPVVVISGGSIPMQNRKTRFCIIPWGKSVTITCARCSNR